MSGYGEPSAPRDEEAMTDATRAREVWVFGAGITGLTAAHELAERGFKVTVIEKDPDVRFFGEPAVGGMAKTQWCVADDEGKAPRAARPVVPAVRVSFVGDSADPRAWDSVLDPFVGRLRELYGSRVPPLRAVGFVQDGESPGLARARAEALKAALDEKLKTSAPGTEVVAQAGLLPLPSQKKACAEVEVRDTRLPGEHGFRYFPSFYWHVFDTMRRIRLLDDRARSSPRRYQTVFDNLVSTERVSLATRRVARAGDTSYPEGARGGKTIVIPRRPPRSIREAVEVLRALVADLGHQPSDVAHIALKLARYLTSGPARRATYEQMTFAEFVEADKLTRQCREDLDKAPEVLGGMRSSESDARTQGNVALQILLGDLRDTGVLDATLNGPTSSVWFLPWRDYLSEVHQVKFREGTLLGFKALAGRVVPRIKWPGTLDRGDPREDTQFVLALDLPAYLPVVDGDPDRLNLCAAFLEAQQEIASQEGIEKQPGDFAALNRWIQQSCWNWSASDGAVAQSGPMRNLAGVQFFFGANQQPTRGHTMYVDAAWRLSSIAQPSFWSVPRSGTDQPRGLVSVDVGEWHTPDAHGRTAWESTREQIHESVWYQINEHLGKSVTCPTHAHLDEGIVLDAGGKPKGNRTPYLITRPEDWPLRPGVPGGYSVAGMWRKDGALVGSGWVLAGTFMKTFTRLTTMESANESARHAVNALLRAVAPDAPLCEVRDLEDEEPPDLRSLKSLDDKLFAEGLPHVMDTLRTEEWVSALLRTSDGADSGGGSWR